MIQKIEKLRIEHKVSKASLCKNSGVSVQMYSKYLEGSQMTVETAEKMIKHLGYKLAVIKEI